MSEGAEVASFPVLRDADMLQAEYFWLLHRHKDAPPTVSGGELILEMPWTVDDDHLAPIAYRPSARTAPHRQS